MRGIDHVICQSEGHIEDVRRIRHIKNVQPPKNFTASLLPISE